MAPWISIAAAAFSASADAASVAGAESSRSALGGASPAAASNDPPIAAPTEPKEPALSTPLIQFGVAFTIEQVLAAGPICVDPCILTSGGGIAIRVGKRTVGPLYFGLGYELSKQGSNNIYRLGILQQIRAEARYYFETGRVTQPFLQGSAGAVGYGNEWGIQTQGPMLSAGAGAQAQIARNLAVGIGLSYRALVLTSFVDSGGAARAGGVASVLGIDLLLEGLDIWPWARKEP